MLLPLLIFIIITLVAIRNTSLAIGMMLAIRILIPSFVRTPIIPFSLNISLCLSITGIIILKYIILKKKKGITTSLYPCIKNYIIFLFLLLFIPKDLSFSTQFSGWMKIIIIDLVPGLLLCFCIKDIKQIRKILYIIYGSICIAGIYGIFSYIIKLNPYIVTMSIIYDAPVDYTGILEEVRGAIQGRTQGTLSHPLVWGQIINVLSLFLLIIRKRIKKKIFIPIYTILFLNIVLCGSRSILLSNLIALLLIYIKLPTKKIVTYTSIGIIGSLIIFNIAKQNDNLKLYVATIEASVFFWNQEKSDEIEIKGSSVNLREKQLIESFNLIQNDFFTGLGQGWIDNYFSKNEKHPIMLGFESIIFRRLVENGVLGLIIWFFFYSQLYKRTLLYTKKSGIDIKIIFIPYLVSLMMTDSFESFYLFLCLMVILCQYIYLKKSEIRKPIKCVQNKPINNTSQTTSYIYNI